MFNPDDDEDYKLTDLEQDFDEKSEAFQAASDLVENAYPLLEDLQNIFLNAKKPDLLEHINAVVSEIFREQQYAEDQAERAEDALNRYRDRYEERKSELQSYKEWDELYG